MTVLLALALAVAPADPPPPVWQGVWQGTVGTLPVRVCLARRGDAYSVGSYYYLSKLRPIRLEQQGGSREWAEGWVTASDPPAPRWRFDTLAADALGGEWSGGGRTLGFRLTRVAGTLGEDEPCGSLLFNAPRLRPLRVTTTRASRDGTGYTRLRFDPGPAFPDVALESFALDGDAPATRRINARLRKDMPLEPARGDWYECVAGGLAAHGDDGDYDQTIAPVLVTARWLAATDAVGYDCGGAHPDNAVSSLTFDRTTGAEIDLHDWLAPTAVKRERLSGIDRPVVTLRPGFRGVVVRQARGIDPDCRESVAGADFWDIGLARTGLRFTPSLAHVEQACAEETLLPWHVLAPYLSAAGRTGMASLRQAATSAPTRASTVGRAGGPGS